MAEMVPDRLPLKASVGEKKLFSVLQKLPDDYIVYYEPIVEDRYPDFVVICPDLGLLVIRTLAEIFYGKVEGLIKPELLKAHPIS